MDIIRRIKSFFKKEQPHEPQESRESPSHSHYSIYVDNHEHEDKDDIGLNFVEMERLLHVHRDHSAKKMKIAPEDMKLISVSFVFAHEEVKPRRGRDGEAVSFASGIVYRDANSRELIEILDAVMDDCED